MAGSSNTIILNSADFIKADSRNLPKVENVMILEFMATNSKHNVSEIRGAKMLMSSRVSYLSTAVGYVQVSRTGSNCVVKARIVPEHRISDKLYTVLCQIDEMNDVIVDSVCQDCAASAGGCKHSLLLLFWLEKRSSEPSPTETCCYWNKPSLSSARTQHVTSKDIFVKAKKPKLEVKDSSVLQEFKEECAKRQVKNSLIINYSELHEFNSKNIFDMMSGFLEAYTIHSFCNFQQYLKSKITIDTIEEINIKTMGQADSKYWHSIRQGRLTASKLYEAAHCNTDGSLVQQILGGYKIPETKPFNGKIGRKSAKSSRTKVKH
ncbi:unnamed protein product [Spodoptera littoralis]|uniref:SWIM-type domain-containing protein n=1 Tax=Spodoptera littoralis TaxID=7109 RepID=A0A9P0I827_SPOLI|nr:unnamed protein product [Spodoptera littoralis]CAH1640539.1 unnamed protein product [Spodoptera littoralis]